MKYFYLFFLLVGLSFALPHSAYANMKQRKLNKPVCCCAPLVSIHHQNHWYAELGLGWIFNSKDHDIYVNQLDATPDSYLPNGENNNAMLTLSAGYHWFFQQVWLPAASLGIEYSYIPQQNNHGQVEQFSDPKLINYNYNYKTLHQSLSLLGKLDLYRWNQFMPFVLVGIGNSWNHIQSYQETALSGITPRVSPGFSNGSQHAWKTTLGVGLDYQPIQNLLVSLAYRYDNFNNGKSGPGLTTFSNTQVHNKSYANSVLLSVQYLFA